MDFNFGGANTNHQTSNYSTLTIPAKLCIVRFPWKKNSTKTFTKQSRDIGFLFSKLTKVIISEKTFMFA